MNPVAASTLNDRASGHRHCCRTQNGLHSEQLILPPLTWVRPVIGDGPYEPHYHYYTHVQERKPCLLIRRFLIHLLVVPPFVIQLCGKDAKIHDSSFLRFSVAFTHA
ncbi:hypothetical protein AVEN_15061-1 [Araneus ventricosus]|uniref:Uncharacterized protein n=1 Tax=Araneus ventricosus TaxID=182803 RepID=A0A4Y2R7F6_ARAVE|nr:hypothetical protein AVEN_103703-1 [Araneus ventricosus]GBN71650.1 hypothetical protein AVEN_15061-1 [Araneus ventricosus]